MSAIVIILVAAVIFIVAYLTYGKWLAKQWGVDPANQTPAHTMNDGVDYVPAKAPVLLGHHFASIAGAGPINGPIQAAIFGWVPVLLWVIIGGIFFGGVHDFSSLFASARNKGKSIGELINVTMGRSGKRLFIIFAFLTLVLVVAAFSSIVVSTFASTNAATGLPLEAAAATRNGQVASSSVFFMILAIIFGFLVYRRNAPIGIATIVGVALMAGAIALGMSVPFYLPATVWFIIIGIYIFVASVTPVWILLQPRDYLNSFLLYAMMIAGVLGIFVANPTMNLEPFKGFIAGPNNDPLFPMLFITVACGAISGFHSLVGSGTTSKQLDRETDAKVIGYGGMLIECFLAVIAVIAVSSLYDRAAGTMPEGTPAVVLATAISQFLGTIGLPIPVVSTIITLAVSAFALTSLDTATRLARFLFQEFFIEEADKGKPVTGAKKLLTNMYFATAVIAVLGIILGMGGYSAIWPLFGAANQLLAGLALLGVSLWLVSIGKNNKMFHIPMCFMLVATLCALVIGIVRDIGMVGNVMAGTAPPAETVFANVIQVVFGILLFALAIVLTVNGVKHLLNSSKNKANSANA